MLNCAGDAPPLIERSMSWRFTPPPGAAPHASWVKPEPGVLLLVFMVSVEPGMSLKTRGVFNRPLTVCPPLVAAGSSRARPAKHPNFEMCLPIALFPSRFPGRGLLAYARRNVRPGVVSVGNRKTPSGTSYLRSLSHLHSSQLAAGLSLHLLMKCPLIDDINVAHFPPAAASGEAPTDWSLVNSDV